MPRSRHEDVAFKYRHFDQDVFVLCVCWYVSYRLRYRDLGYGQSTLALFVSSGRQTGENRRLQTP
ncbi:MAG: hypothetical protein WBD34_08335 [Burkholderiaceae bacterium]